RVPGEPGGDRRPMGRVLIEVATPDQEVGGVGGLEDGHASGAEDPDRLVEQHDERIEGEVLDQVEAADGREAGVGDAPEMGQRVHRDDVQPALTTILYHVTIEVDSARLHAFVAKELQPFSATTADVQRSAWADLLHDRQIHAQAVFDLLSRAAEVVVK